MNRKILNCLSLVIPGLILSACWGHATAQERSAFRVVNREIEIDVMQKIVRLDERNGIGIAWVKNRKFSKGEIEFDVKGADKFQGSFVGLAFHGLNDTTYQAVYFRPFNFNVDDSLRHAHAVQYLSNPKYDWPLLRAHFPGKYEKSVPAGIDPSGWFHVRLVVTDSTAKVYVNRQSTPLLTTTLLGKTRGRQLGFWAGEGSGGAWKNLKIRHQ